MGFYAKFYLCFAVVEYFAKQEKVFFFRSTVARHVPCGFVSAFVYCVGLKFEQKFVTKIIFSPVTCGSEIQIVLFYHHNVGSTKVAIGNDAYKL